MCDYELINFKDLDQAMKRYYGKQRRRFEREISIFKEKAKNDRMRMKFANEKMIKNLSLVLVFQLESEYQRLKELSYVKYKTLIKHRKVDDIHVARRQIQQLHLEMHALENKSKRFNDILYLNQREQEIYSISPRVITSMTTQLKNKHTYYK